ncbi:MAG: FtsX-like permease family protein [Treponema sp.]|jgi:putative ABC transport system permease protein|nr:FtsX-like permease family protein [Treponema sp.]
MNKQRFYIKMALSSILRRKSRMLVALLAVSIGATILSGLVTVYYDIPRQMGREFRSYGANFILLPSGNDAVISAELMERALAFLPEESLAGIAPYRYRQVKINEQPFMAAGTDLAGARKTSPYWLVQGRWPEAPGEALIGQEAADMIRLLPGSKFTLTGSGAGGNPFSRGFTVSGVLQTGGAEEAFIFMSLADLEAMTGESGGVDVVECSVSAGAEVLEALARRIGENLPGLSPRLVKRLTDSEGAVLTKLQALVALVSAVVLLLIMICVATTMMAVVAERRREIGLRKALGASNRDLAQEFMGEGVFLGGFGGALGAAAGCAFAQAVGLNVFNRSIAFQPLFVLLTLAASILITVLACLIPVRSAAEVDPAIVLRGE